MAALGHGLATAYLVLKNLTGLGGGSPASPLALHQRDAALINDRAGANILTRV